MGLFTKRQLTGQVDKNSLPRHVAVIMDGNGRWAQKLHDAVDLLGRALPVFRGKGIYGDILYTYLAAMADYLLEVFRPVAVTVFTRH